MTLQQRVVELRTAQRISQARLAEKSGVGRVTIARIETGDQTRPTWQTVRKLARAFGLTMDEFLRDVEDMEPAGV